MFFNPEAVIRVETVLRLEEAGHTDCVNRPRRLWALSFRKHTSSRFEYEGGVLDILPGSVALVPAGVGYRRVSEDDRLLAVHFSVTGDCEKAIRVFHPEEPARYAYYFEELYRAEQECEAGYRFRMNELLYRLFYMIAAECEKTESRSGASLASRAARYIEQNAENPLFSVSELETHFRVSGAYLRRKFGEFYGKSPKMYLTETRLHRAAALLESGYLSVRETAKKCGFENEKYFSTVFRKRMGVTPSVFAHGETKR